MQEQSDNFNQREITKLENTATEVKDTAEGFNRLENGKDWTGELRDRAVKFIQLRAKRKRN